MTSKRKITYQSKGNQFPRIALSGKVYLKYVDDEIEGFKPALGDLMFFLSIEQPRHEPWDYTSTGRSGYVKADLWDGRDWRPLSLEEFFKDRDYFFRKSERPQDTVAVCKALMEKQQGIQVMRKYREHYAKEE